MTYFYRGRLQGRLFPKRLVAPMERELISALIADPRQVDHGDTADAGTDYGANEAEERCE